MIARIRKSMEEKDQGFTLIELLVVMIIIGILAAIAIPVFLNQRKRAVDSSVKSDLRSAANEVESAFVNDQAYPASGANLIDPATYNVKVSSGTTLTYTLNANGQAYCILGANTGATHSWVYKSDAGGLQPANVTTC